MHTTHMQSLSQAQAQFHSQPISTGRMRSMSMPGPSAPPVSLLSSSPPRTRVHIIFDYGSLPCPTHVPLDRFLAMVLSFSSVYGEVVSFTLPILSSVTPLDAHSRQICRDAGVQIEEIQTTEATSETFLLTRLLRLTLELQATATTSASGSSSTPRDSVVILSNHPSLTSSLALMRHSSLFAHIVLIHGPDASSDLISSASYTLSINDFLSGRAHPLLQAEGRPPIHQQRNIATIAQMSATTQEFSPHRRPTQLETSLIDDNPPTSLLGLHPNMASPNQLGTSPMSGIPGPSPSQGLLPTPTHPGSGRRFFGTPRVTLPICSPSPLSGKLPPYSGKGNRFPSSAPSSPTHRAFFPPNGTQSPSQLSHASFARAGSDRHQFHSASSMRTRACIQAYTRIIAYCESEKLIPRESVLKKRLVDSKVQLSEAGGGGIEFEEFLSTIVASGAGCMEGEAPQRIVWPRGPDGAARHFACADFFTPVSRLSTDQNAELLEFLYTVQPEVERGRFGFANWLAAHGPPFVRLLAHGVLVELVQLLLNRKVLLFRKGRVSVASRSEANEAASLGMLLSATDFQTPAISRVTSPSITRPTSPHEVDATIWEPAIGHHEDPWRTAANAQIDRTLLQPTTLAGSSISRSSMSSPRYPSGPVSYGHQPLSWSVPRAASLPVTRAASPTQSSNTTTTTQSDIMRMRVADISLDMHKSQMPSSFSKLDSRAPFDSTIASVFDLPAPHAEQEFGTATVGGKATSWLKEERPGSGVASALSSRRSSFDDAWRTTPNRASGAAPFESSSGFIGESMDACDPSAVLAAKLSHLNSVHLLPPSHLGVVSDDLFRFTTAMQYRPCFHFEKSGAAHTPEWVAIVTFTIDTKRYQLRSAIHSKKDLAKNEVCMRVLQMIEDESIRLLPHEDVTRDPEHVDSVIDLARLLNFLQQAPVVYYLTRVTPAAGRFDARTLGSGPVRRNSNAGLTGHGMWNGSTRIQVKSVNVLTGEAQPTVSASTPFTHSATAATKDEAKEIIAASLLQQIQRARVVNPALFNVLSAARHNLAAPARHADPDVIWRQVGSSTQSPIIAPSSHLPPSQSQPPPQVDITRLASSSLFSMHTPVSGRSFAGISNIGIATPISTTLHLPSTHLSTLDSSLDHYSHLDSALDDLVHPVLSPPAIIRSISESMNAEAELTSAASAEKALQEHTPKHNHEDIDEPGATNDTMPAYG